jgi:hypothetical protein
VETELDFADRSEWIRVERDSTLCELHNEDVCIICGWLNLGKKSYVSYIDLLPVFVQALFLFRV